jgi:CheY-like chemotaxis protein
MHNVSADGRGGLPLEKGDYVNMEITDSGAGIPEDHLSKIFDPYFTTKQKGTGLGLATTYSIIKKHGGAITVRSQPGAGTTFSLYLPASAQEHSPEEVRAAEPIHGKGRILVMDDEEIVRLVARHMAEELGYEVSLAENGEQAIEMFLEAMAANRPFDVVILDLTVRGGMGGKDTLTKMAALEPSVRAIVSSGYSSDDILSHYKDFGFQNILIKPYEAETLGRMLHELLHREGPS